MKEEPSQEARKTTRLTQWAAPLVVVAGLLFVIASFYLEENWRGDFVWRRTKAELQAKHEVLDWKHFLPVPPPDDRNMMKVPGMEQTFIKGGAGVSHFNDSDPVFQHGKPRSLRRN